MTDQTVQQPNLEIATLGGGCFWCVEAVFLELKGVMAVRSGYAGGKTANPTYREVCSGASGHAEVIQVIFDKTLISYRQILEVFFTAHDPTTLNRQGNDVGTQYRSVIYFHSEEQRQIAGEVIHTEASVWWDAPVVTEVSPMPAFYPAEDYHQDYYRNNPYQPYCAFVISPKLKKVRERFRPLLRADVVK